MNTRTRRFRAFHIFILAFAAFLAVSYSLYAVHGPFSPFYVNLSNSMPRGIYVRTALRVHPGSFVIIPSSSVRLFGEHPPKYLLKAVLSYHGELVTINRAGLFLDDKLIALRVIDRGIDYRGVLCPDQALLIGQSAMSFDSRYFGPVKITDLTDVRPLLTW
jgi:type IV secretory pathway protease TraF